MIAKASPKEALRSDRSARDHQDGFTLVELIVSLAVLAFMMVIAWSATTGAVFARDNLEKSQARDHEIRVAMNLMVRDLGAAYLSANENQNATDRRTKMIGKSNSSVDELVFSSMSHRVMWADTNESEQTVITFEEENDPEDSTMTNLIRRELRRPPNDTSRATDEPEEVDVLIRDVSEVHFEYWDHREKAWQKEWNSTQADGQPSRLPSRVRITVAYEVEDSEGDTETVTLSTQARIALQEELKFFAN